MELMFFPVFKIFPLELKERRSLSFGTGFHVLVARKYLPVKDFQRARIFFPPLFCDLKFFRFLSFSLFLVRKKPDPRTGELGFLSIRILEQKNEMFL